VSRRKTPFGAAAAEAWGTRPRRQWESELDITPMIDVTFLLLIFFMVSSTMQATPDLDVPPAKHGTGVETKHATVVVIKGAAVAGSASPTILIDGLEVNLEGVQASVKEGLEFDRSHVIIKADGLVPHGFVQEVIRVVNSIEGTTFSIGVRDKRNFGN